MSNGTAVKATATRCTRSRTTSEGDHIVTVRAMLTGAAAEVGAIRFNLPTGAYVLLAVDQDLAERSELLAELCDPRDTLVFA